VAHSETQQETPHGRHAMARLHRKEIVNAHGQGARGFAGDRWDGSIGFAGDFALSFRSIKRGNSAEKAGPTTFWRV